MYIPPPTYQVTQPRPQVQQQTHGPPIEHYIPPPTYQVTQQNHQQMPMGNQYQQIPNQNTTPSQRPYIPTNTQLDRRTNRTQLNHKTQQETVPQCTNLESKITNSKMPKKVPTQARKEFSDTYSVSTVIIETNIMIQQRRMRGGIQHCDTTEKDESIQ
jgi:hypothetical protein